MRRTGSLLTAIINEGPRPRGVDGGADDAVQRERWCRCCCNPSFFRCAEVCGGVRPPLGWAGWLGLAWAAPPGFHHPVHSNWKARQPAQGYSPPQRGPPVRYSYPLSGGPGPGHPVVNRDDEELAAIGLRGPILAHQL